MTVLQSERETGKRTRVLVVAPDLRGGGAQKVMVRLLGSFDRGKIEPVFLAIDYAGPFCREMPEDVKVVDLGVKRARYALPKLIKAINGLAPDVILSTIERINFLLLFNKPFLKKKAKLVVREANLPSRVMEHAGPLRKRAYASLYRWLYPKADVIVAQSEKMREELLRCAGVSPEKVWTIHNPVDAAAVERLSRAYNPFPDTARRNIAAVGRLEYQKGFDLLIEAFRRVHERLPDTELYIVGEGSQRGNLRKQAEDLRIGKHVHLVGFQENPYPYIRYGDLFVLPSRYEGFPNILLEALCCGAKIVAADCDSGPREILCRPEYGLLVEAGRPDRLASGMLQALSGPGDGSPGSRRSRDYDARSIAAVYEEALLNA